MTCHNCRIDAPKHGKHRNGLQRYRCSQCGKTFTEPHAEAFHMEMHLEEPQGLLAIQLLCEGTSVRTCERIVGLHRNTILELLLIAARRSEALLAERIHSLRVENVQCDEIWGYVFKKQSHRHGAEENFWQMGDAWCFVGIERTSKLVLAHHLGKRTVSSAMQFMRKLAAATDPNHRYQLTSDGLKAYNYAVGMVLGDRVDYAQLIKIYAYNTPEDARRYSPPEVVEAIPTPIYGDPDEKQICTSHIERQNLTMRMSIRRLTRLTNAFSKKWDNLRAALALHFAYYNFCRKHITLRGATPAMAAGITDHVWSIQELISGNMTA